MSDSISASLVIDAPAEVIFAFLAHPANHQIFDASNMVGDCLTHGRIADVGQVFTMKMTWTDDEGKARQYVTDNHVTDFDEGRTIEWAPARQGRGEGLLPGRRERETLGQFLDPVCRDGRAERQRDVPLGRVDPGHAVAYRQEGAEVVAHSGRRDGGHKHALAGAHLAPFQTLAAHSAARAPEMTARSRRWSESLRSASVNSGTPYFSMFSGLVSDQSCVSVTRVASPW